ncbi:MAG: glycoside hydrolase family 28 protein, partial [Pedobacter sp.]
MNLFKGKIYLIFSVFVGLCSVTTTAAFAQKQVLPVIQQVKFKKDTTSIISFGAKGDGITLNTSNINKAIASVSQKGGGVVLIPSGLWLTGPIELKSNV